MSTKTVRYGLPAALDELANNKLLALILEAVISPVTVKLPVKVSVVFSKNEPEIPLAVKDLIKSAFAPNEPEIESAVKLDAAVP